MDTPTYDQQVFLLKLARKAIASVFNSTQPEMDAGGDSFFKEHRGVFVTLHKEGMLRGCIGYVQAVKPLAGAVVDMARAAAFEDPRFPSLAPDEFDSIDIEISIMSPLEPAHSIRDVVVGKHGIVIRRGMMQGLLLPQVAVEENWDRETFLMHACSKAGLISSAWEDDETSILIFTAEVFSEKSLNRG